MHAATVASTRATTRRTECDSAIGVRRWVTRTLLPMLERQHGYKLLIEERDFPIGMVRYEAIFKAILNSQRTLFVLSRGFNTDSQRRNALQQAYFMWDRKRTNKSIFICYDKRIVMDDGLTAEARALLKWGIKIGRHEKHFWKKLISKMPQKPH